MESSPPGLGTPGPERLSLSFDVGRRFWRAVRSNHITVGNSPSQQQQGHLFQPLPNGSWERAWKTDPFPRKRLDRPGFNTPHSPFRESDLALPWPGTVEWDRVP